jgi:hypothetical protein
MSIFIFQCKHYLGRKLADGSVWREHVQSFELSAIRPLGLWTLAFISAASPQRPFLLFYFFSSDIDLSFHDRHLLIVLFNKKQDDFGSRDNPVTPPTPTAASILQYVTATRKPSAAVSDIQPTGHSQYIP